MTYEHILYEVRDRIATVTLNRPDKLNAWTTTMEGEIRVAMALAAADPGVRVIVLTGAGRGFCAGADMDLLSNIQQDNAGIARRAIGGEPFDATVNPNFQMRYSYFPALPKPVIAAINGPAAGLGLIAALYCDMRFAADTAVFTTSFSRRGLIAEHGISWLLPRLIGPSRAMDLMLSARKVDAAEALRIGLVDRVAKPEALLDEVRAYARDLADMVSPRSMQVMKRQLWEAAFQNLAEATAIGNTEMLASFKSADFKEGVAHFMEKRAPNFSGN
ncbi:enoyl-CoA hydratase [Ferrovibrio sp.]|uniref:enoyl-CoA hydratase n=1 Tax=Ferrovibrio sp. TaxID=1917215 RepID=UPI003D0FBD67